VGLRPLVCFAKSGNYTTVSNYKYTLGGIKRQTAEAGNSDDVSPCEKAGSMKNSGTPPDGIERVDPEQPTAKHGGARTANRARAHRMYEDRGSIDGNEMDDWLQAEAELDGQRNSKAAD